MNVFFSFFSFLESSGEQNISIILNGEESELKFVTDRRGNKVCISTIWCFNEICHNSNVLEALDHWKKNGRKRKEEVGK